jgi:hypothetical protein
MADTNLQRLRRLLPAFSSYVGYFVAGLLLLGILVCLPWATGDLTKWTVFATAVFAVLFYGLTRLYKYWARLPRKTRVWLLFLAGLLVKLSVVLLWKVKPVVDFLSFYDGASHLASDQIVGTLRAERMALFPHYFGYSALLSLFFRVFGASEAIHPVLNAVVSSLGVLLVYDIGRHIKGEKTGFIGAVLWIFLPSQTLYNLLCFGEPVYTVLMLAGFSLLARGGQAALESKVRKTAWYFALFGLCMGVISLFRPIMPILLVAAAIWLFLFLQSGKREFLTRMGAFAGAMLIAFLFSEGGQAYLTLRLQEEVATVPGFTLMVGLSESSGGRWNEADSKRLFSYIDAGMSPAAAQRQMWEDAKERLLSGQIQRPIQLLAKKFVHFWRGDAMAVEYAAKVLPNPSFFKVVSNGFFYAMSLWAAWGAMLAMKRKETSILAPVSLFAVGLTMAHLLVEVATRYHYSAVVSIVFLAAYGLSVRPDFSEGRNKHEQK